MNNSDLLLTQNAVIKTCVDVLALEPNREFDEITEQRFMDCIKHTGTFSGYLFSKRGFFKPIVQKTLAEGEEEEDPSERVGITNSLLAEGD